MSNEQLDTLIEEVEDRENDNNVEEEQKENIADRIKGFISKAKSDREDNDYDYDNDEYDDTEDYDDTEEETEETVDANGHISAEDILSQYKTMEQILSRYAEEPVPKRKPVTRPKQRVTNIYPEYNHTKQRPVMPQYFYAARRPITTKRRDYNMPPMLPEYNDYMAPHGVLGGINHAMNRLVSVICTGAICAVVVAIVWFVWRFFGEASICYICGRLVHSGVALKFRDFGNGVEFAANIAENQFTHHTVNLCPECADRIAYCLKAMSDGLTGTFS